MIKFFILYKKNRLKILQYMHITHQSYHLVRVSEVLACEHSLVAQFLFDSQNLVVLCQSF
jgi:hypothetical protein